jgi:hypothetical protein
MSSLRDVSTMSVGNIRDIVCQLAEICRLVDCSLRERQAQCSLYEHLSELGYLQKTLKYQNIIRSVFAVQPTDKQGWHVRAPRWMTWQPRGQPCAASPG